MATRTIKSLDPNMGKMKAALRTQQQANPKPSKNKQTQNRKR